MPDPKTPLIGLSLRAYARHRRALGLPGSAPSTVYRAARDGRIPRLEDGSIDPAAADAAWLANTRPREDSVDAGEDVAGGTPPAGSMQAARLRKELALAQLRELELRQKSGELIEVESVRRMWFERGRTVRDLLLGLPPRLAASLAAESDQAAVRVLLDREIRAALEALSGDGTPPREGAAAR